MCGIRSLLTCPCIHTCPCLSRWGLFLLGSAWVIMPITEPGSERMAFVDWLVPGSHPTPALGIRRAPPKPRGLRNGGPRGPSTDMQILLSKGSEPLFQVHVFLPKIQCLRHNACLEGRRCKGHSWSPTFPGQRTGGVAEGNRFARLSLQKLRAEQGWP